MPLRRTNVRVSVVAIASAIAFLIAAVLISIKPTHARTGSRETEVRIGVFGLFHPRQLRVTAVASSTLMLQAGDQQILLDSSAGTGEATIGKTAGGMLLICGERKIHSAGLLVSGRNGEPVDFQLAVPGKITRRFRGTLEIIPKDEGLVPIVTMDLETAVASVVAAESLADTPIEALKAQAVASRSYLVSGRGRHANFDFCDTTHCQFLREPPTSESAVAKAVQATSGLVLSYESKPFPAMYTRSCNGETRTPAQVGLLSAGYPYYSVRCEYCRSHPVQWTSRIASSEAKSLHVSDESSRLLFDRRLGWSAVESNDFTIRKQGDETVVEGTGLGHGIGLCQAGARAMAQRRASFQQILGHYYPNTNIVSWSGEVGAASRLR